MGRLGHHSDCRAASAGTASFAVVYGTAMMVNIAWPRQVVYDSAGATWVLQYLGLRRVLFGEAAAVAEA